MAAVRNPTSVWEDSMKMNLCAMFAVICMIAFCVVPVQAGDMGENRNLFKTAGQKERASDFVPVK